MPLHELHGLRVTSIVFALQSPTLLNQLARTTAWQLTTYDLGDTAGLIEKRWLAVPWFAGERRSVDFVAVCTPHQYQRAGNLFPRARLVWVLHNGQPHMTPQVGKLALAFSRRVAALHAARAPNLRIGVAVPAYTPEPRWQSWGPRVWTLLNRPTHDRSEYLANIQTLARGYPLEAYGQGWTAGVLEGPARLQLEARSAAYLTPLPDWAGFGLAQHECLARGVPLVGSRWGDLGTELDPAYDALVDDPAAQRAALARLHDPAEGPAYAAHLSRLGLAFIDRCRSQENMDTSIREVLTLWG